MVNREQFEEICNKYGLDSKKLIKNNENVLEKADYNSICYVLDFLRDTLKVTPNNIEKCPSILYLKIEAIKENYNFLKEKEINMKDVETCLHILSTEPSQLKRTYEYVSDENRYGKKYIEQTTSILRVPVERIQEIEERCPELTKENILSAAISRKDVDEIKKIEQVCKDNEIEVTGSVFYRIAAEIKEIVEVCKENGIEATGNVFRRTAAEIKEIVEVCKENGIEATGSVFLKTATEIKGIVEVCKENRIEITGSIFVKNSKQLKENIEYIKQNYGEEYLTPLIVSKNLKHLQKTLPYLQSIGVLEIIKTSASILMLTVEEIKERQAFIESIDESIVKGDKFNSIFGLSRKNYQKKVKEYEEKKKLIGEIKGAIQEGQELDKQINKQKQEQK